MSKYKTSKKVKKSFPPMSEILTIGWVVAMFTLFPIIVDNYYFNILETKYLWFLGITITYLALMLIWGLISGKIAAYIGRCKQMRFIEWAKSTFTIPDIAAIVFIIIATISTLCAYPYIKEAFWGNEGRYTGFLLTLLYVVAYFCITRFFRFNRWCITTFFVVAIFLCLFGITDYFNMNILGFKDRMHDWQKPLFTSTFGNINTYTTYVGIVVASAGAMFATTRENIKRVIFYFICYAISVIALTMGSSDNGYLTMGALLAFLPFVAWRYRRGIRRYVILVATYASAIYMISVISDMMQDKVVAINGLFQILSDISYLYLIAVILWLIVVALYILDYRKNAHILISSDSDIAPRMPRLIWMTMVIAIMMITAIVLVISNINHDFAINNFPAISEYLIFDDAWGTSRGYIWRACIELYSKLSPLHKIFGTGPDTFGIYVYNNIYDEMVRITGQVYDSAHNEYLQYFFTIGPIGLVAYLVLLVSVIKGALKKARDMFVLDASDKEASYIIGFAFAILCYAIQATVNINLPIVTPIMWVFMMLIVNSFRRKSE